MVEYFISYFYFKNKHDYGVGSVGVTKKGEIEKFKDVEEIQEYLSDELNKGKIIILNYKLINKNRKEE